MAKTSPSNFPRTKKSMNKLKNNIGFTVLTAYKLFRVCKDEKEVTILCWIVGKIINRINIITEKYGFEKLEIYRVDRDGDKNGIWEKYLPKAIQALNGY